MGEEPAGVPFFHKNGKARFISVSCRAPANQVDPEYPFILNTGRVRDHWHTLTRTGQSPRLSQHTTEPYAEIHPVDAARMQIKNGMLVSVTSRWGSVTVRGRVCDEQLQGSIFIPIHWNYQYASMARIDCVVNPVTDPVSGQPESKHTPVTIAPLAVSWKGFIIVRRLLEAPPARYWVCHRGRGYWHYEIAGADAPDNWRDRAIRLLEYNDQTSDWLEYVDAGTGCYRFAKISNGKLESCLFIAGESSQLPHRAWLQDLFKKATLDKSDRACLLAGKGNGTTPDTGPVVCSCFSVRRKTLLKTIHEKNITDVMQIGEYLQAGTNCGSCIPEIRQLIQSMN